MDIFDDTFQYFCVSPFRHGARPVSTEIQTHRVYTKMQFWGGSTPQSLSVNRRDAACRVSPAKITKETGNTITHQMGSDNF